MLVTDRHTIEREKLIGSIVAVTRLKSRSQWDATILLSHVCVVGNSKNDDLHGRHED